MAVCSAVLVVNALLQHPRVWLLFVIAAVTAALDGFQRPSLDALVPRLVERHEIPAAAALGSFRWTLGGIAGPALGGALIASFGLPATYGFDVVTFALDSLVADGVATVRPGERGAKLYTLVNPEEDPAS